MSETGSRRSARGSVPRKIWANYDPHPKRDTNRKSVRNRRRVQAPTDKTALLNASKQVRNTAKGKVEKVKKVIKSVKQKSHKVKVISNFKFIPFLSKLAQLKADASALASKLIPALLNENRLELFGGLPEPITRGEISEPYNAGSIQGPVLYGVGTGKSPLANITAQGKNYSTYVDNVIYALEATGRLPAGLLPIPSDILIPRCWATGIPVTFGQGKTKPEWPWDKAGGGTNHEMEHAIKCIKQAMLNFLSQSTTEDDKTMHVLLKTFFISILGEDNSGKAESFAAKITKLLRKQQAIAGLPSCALFNQFKCGLDLIKVELKPIPGQGWFYVEVSANTEDELDIEIEGVVTRMNVFTLLAKKMKGAKSQSGKMEDGKYNPKGGCNFYGMGMPDDKNKDNSVRHRSAWAAIARLDQCYKTEGGGFAPGKPSDSPSVYQMINDEDKYLRELQYAYSLKEMSEEELANLMIERTKIVCAEYNKISEIPVIGWMLSGITIAASLMMLSISMGRVLESDDELKTTKDPQLYKLGSKATGFLTRLATEGETVGISYMEQFLSDGRIDTYQADFLAKVSNPVTRSYLEAQLFGQGGGSLQRKISDAVDIPDEPRPLGFNTGKSMDQLKTMTPTQGFPTQGFPTQGFPTQGSDTGLDEEMAGVAEGDVAEVATESGEIDMGQSNVLSSDDIALLARMEDTPEREYEKNEKLFWEVESLLSQRYDGLEDVFSRILDGDDEDGLIYIDKILKDEEVEIAIKLATAVSASYKKKKTARKKKKETVRKKKKETMRKKRKEPTCKKAGQTEKRKRRRTVKKDSLYQRLLKRLGF